MEEQDPKRMQAVRNASAPDHRAAVRRRRLAETVEFWNMSLTGVWLHYVGLGGDLTEYEIDAYIYEAYSMTPYQHDILAEAVNELIEMLPPPPRAPLTSDPEL